MWCGVLLWCVQVLTRALQVWGLSALNVDSEEVTKAEQPFEAQREEAFICNLQVGMCCWVVVVVVVVQWRQGRA